MMPVDAARRRVAEVSALLHGPAALRQPHQSPAVAQILAELDRQQALLSPLESTSLTRLLFHTQYHHVPKLDVAPKW